MEAMKQAVEFGRNTGSLNWLVAQRKHVGPPGPWAFNVAFELVSIDDVAMLSGRLEIDLVSPIVSLQETCFSMEP
jgi:hypothetical protein